MSGGDGDSLAAPRFPSNLERDWLIEPGTRPGYVTLGQIANTTGTSDKEKDEELLASHGEMIGQSKFGKVYIAQYDSGLKRITCAMKKINMDELNPFHYELVKQEVANIRDVKHPGLLELLRCIVVSDYCLVITPLMGHLSCSDIIRNYYPDGLPEPAIGLIIKDLIFGLTYLHSKFYLHRGIKASHLLVGNNGQVKLSGFRYMKQFEYASATYSDPTALQGMRKYLNWLAPEILLQDRQGFGLKADIYSIGVTILELGNGVVPNADVSAPGILVRVFNEPTPRLWDKNNLPSQESKANPTPEEVAEMDRPYVKKHYSKEITHFVQMCVALEPEIRASLAELCKMKFYLQYYKQEHSALLKELPRLGAPVSINPNEAAGLEAGPSTGAAAEPAAAVAARLPSGPRPAEPSVARESFDWDFLYSDQDSSEPGGETSGPDDDTSEPEGAKSEPDGAKSEPDGDETESGRNLPEPDQS